MRPLQQLTTVITTLTHLVRGSICCVHSSRTHLTESLLCDVRCYHTHYAEISPINLRFRSLQVLFIRRQAHAKDYNI
jgi:hypothetical protein